MTFKRFLVHLLSCFLSAVILTSCHKQEVSPFSQERKKEADSLLKSVNDIEPLQKLLADYQKTGNKEGEMMATKKLGRLLRESNRFHEAIEIHLRGSELAKTLCDTIEIIQALNNIGTNYRRMSMLDKASCYHYKALQLCEEYHDKKTPSALKNRVVSLNGIGNICLRIEDYPTADSVFRIALDGETQLGSALGQAINLANIGSIFEAKGLTDSARIYYHRSMEMNIKAQSDLGIALCHQHFGSLYEKRGKLEQAKSEYQKVYEMAEKIDVWHWLDACISLARLNHKNGENDKAIALLERAKSEGQSSHSYDQLEDIYHLLHDIHAANHQYDKALAAYKISKDYSDSIVNEKKLLDVQNERIRFENQLRQREVESMRELTMPKHIDLRFVTLENRVEMDFIPDYVTKIIHNLVSNAIKFTPKDGHVYLTANVEKDFLRLCIADNGCGIPKEEVQHIFEMFFQGKSGKVELGTGIGLSLVHQLVESMQGTIQVHTAESEGSVFVVRLPLQQGEGKWEQLKTSAPLLPIPVDTSAEDPETNPTDISIHEEDGKPVILIVEDNNDVQRYIGSVLPDFHLHYARNGEEGIEKALRIMPDLIVTDLMMPKKDGLEMSRDIRSSEILNHIPIVAITARCSEEDKIKGLECGINNYLYKPFNSKELNICIQNLLEQRRQIQKQTNFMIIPEDTSGDKSHNKLTQEEQKFLTKIVNETYTQMANENVNLNDLAQNLCMSLKQVNRKVISITGDSLSKYVMQIRMHRAKQLLDSDKNYTIAEVGQRCGFNENSNFTRTFKTFYDITPSQYRRMPRNNENKTENQE